MSSHTPRRGRKGWERRLSEREDAAPAVPQPPAAPVEPSVRSMAEPKAPAPGRATSPTRPGPGRRLPNLAGLLTRPYDFAAARLVVHSALHLGFDNAA